nr:uncharacterized protein LOC108130981 [Drosophila bipectinata]
MPPGFVTEDKFIDRSKMTFVKDDNGAIHISGNGTVVWDIQSTDRVELDLAAFKQERGKWKPTPYKTTIKDFCKFLYEKNQPHYSYSIAHVTNKDYTKEKCLTPGTVYEFEPYVMKMVIGVSPVGPGHYKGIVHFSAFDSNGVKRPNQFCLETTGNLS